MALKKFPTRSGELYFGSVPSDEALEEMKEIGIDVIWNLASELEDFADYESEFVGEVLQGDIEDFSVPSSGSKFVMQLKYIAGLLNGGKKVFLHCMGGRGRSSMVLACLSVLNGLSADRSLKLVKQYGSGPETDAQINFVKFIEKYFGKK